MSKPYVPSGTCIIADDLTGACDAAAAFARRGASTEVLPQPGSRSSGAEVQALCSATRDIPPEQAEAVLRELFQGLDIDASAQLFKKIDSVFRGNTLVEIAATVRALPRRLAVIAPAFPALGRICTGGMLHVRDLSGRTSTPLRERFNAAGLRPHWLAPASDASTLEDAMRAALSAGATSFFCEAASHQDMQAVVEAARSLDRPLVWIGSAGLAHALAEALYADSPDSPPPPALLPDGTLLAFTGSNHPVSCRQLTILRERHSVANWPSTLPKDIASPVIVLRVERGQTTDAHIREAIGGIDRASVGCLLLNGGDTALQVCRALDIRAIRLHTEFDPGIPVGIACGGRFDDCTVLLKSGGFGDPDLLSRIAHQCTSGREITA